jgi:hypothetical protein
LNSLNIFKEVQQKRFIASMKKMKSTDIPDLIKTVKAKKLPREALKAITNKFSIADNKISLKYTVESLKVESNVYFDDYVKLNS